MIKSIIKRDGRVVSFDQTKIAAAIMKSFAAGGSQKSAETADELAELVVKELEKDEKIPSIPTVEQTQDMVERVLIQEGYVTSAKLFIIYRAERSRVRELNSNLMKVFDEITNKDAKDSNTKRENANINGDTAMGAMLKFGSEGAKRYYKLRVLDPNHAKAHNEGDIHIHDLDFYTLTTTCCQIDLLELFKNGFSTGHGVLRTPNDIYSYSALACIAIQANQNDQHGGQSVVNFDYGMAPGVRKTFRKRYRDFLAQSLELLYAEEDSVSLVMDLLDEMEDETGKWPVLTHDNEYDRILCGKLVSRLPKAKNEAILPLLDFVHEHAKKETDRATFQAMEALIHNLNTMNSRAGAQVPFSSINYGMDTSPEGRMVIRNLLRATEDGLGRGETPIFPIQIFRVKEGVSYNPHDPNYDLFRLAIRTSAKRLFPNFSFLDAPFNKKYYKEGHPETEIAYMGCRTRVISNAHDPDHEACPRRGNLSYTSVNLPRLAILAEKNMEKFYRDLERTMDLVVEQLDQRFSIIAQKKVRNFPFLMGEGVWMDSEKLGPNDCVGEVLKHGTLSIGFIGLAEALVALRGAHHGADPESQRLGLEIIGFMRQYCDTLSEERKLNYTLLATPAEGLSGRFVAMDRDRFGVIPGVTDKDYYTNSFHVPVYFTISAFAKITVEAPYHALTNAGHISYIEMDGDPLKNLEAFERVVRHMHDTGIGYGSINHPVDRDPVCGYSGIIGDTCPRCGRKEPAPGVDTEVFFERIRRITGYLSSLNRFNNAKRKEEKDRLKQRL